MTTEEITLLNAERDRIGREFGPSVIDAALREAGAVTMPTECFITSRTLMAKLGIDTATTLLDQLETYAASDPVIKRVYRMLEDVSSGGVDIGIADARTKIQQLGTAFGWPQALIDQLLAFGERPMTRSEELFGRQLTIDEIKEAF